MAICLEETLDLFAAKAAEKQIELIYHIDENVPHVIEQDGVRLRQILANLIGNAVKFTDEGEVVVSVTCAEETDDSLMLCFSVRDTGIGIPADRMDRLFQSFSQVDASMTRRYGGTGLGLVSSKQLCELMGGRIWVESQEGEGSTFYFTIAAEAVDTLSFQCQGQEALAGKSVLIVDDNATNRRILLRQVQRWGMQGTALPSGTATLEHLRANPDYHVIILDMQMPEMDGVTLAAQIQSRAKWQKTPLVMLTSIDASFIRPEDRMRFAAFLTKPVKHTQLCSTLAAICAPQTEQAQGSGTLSPFAEVLAHKLPLRILVAEDNAVNQKVALRILDRLGYQADVVADGAEAVAAVEQRAYDVILMDLQMPNVDGLTATRAIRSMSLHHQPYIIALTANVRAEDRRQCLEAGMNDFLSKPIQVHQLIETLQSVGNASHREVSVDCGQTRPE